MSNTTEEEDKPAPGEGGWLGLAAALVCGAALYAALLLGGPQR